jgi:hypothetical protein
MSDMSAPDLESAFQRLGELLAAEGLHYSITLIGGAALSLQGLVARTTDDADILTFASDDSPPVLTPSPDPLPAPLQRAISRVGRDLGLGDSWLNHQVARQWSQGFPEGFARRLTWRTYAALRVGLAAREDLIAFKLFAAVDRGDPGRGGVDERDLIQLAPTRAELERAAAWVRGQDAGAEFPTLVQQVIERVERQVG